MSAPGLGARWLPEIVPRGGEESAGLCPEWAAGGWRSPEPAQPPQPQPCCLLRAVHSWENKEQGPVASFPPEERSHSVPIGWSLSTWGLFPHEREIVTRLRGSRELPGPRGECPACRRRPQALVPGRYWPALPSAVWPPSLGTRPSQVQVSAATRPTPSNLPASMVPGGRGSRECGGESASVWGKQPCVVERELASAPGQSTH